MDTTIGHNDMSTKGAPRIDSVDIFRALTMLLMLFVNDIPGLRNIPHWLLHAKMDEDMMGFSDLIFPAFLFCMGMSVPLAIENRYAKGDNTMNVIAHLVERTFALVVMGIYMVNCSSVGAISYPVFTLIMFMGIMLTWNQYPKSTGYKGLIWKGLRATGILALAFLMVYKDINNAPMERSWWGILGLIGWTYAVCSVIYLFTRHNLKANMLCWIVVMLLAILNHSELIPWHYATHSLLLPFIPSDWTLHALGMSGLLTTLLMQKYAHKEHPSRFISMLCITAVVMFVLGVVSHQFWIISKIQATPTWLFYCLALFMPLLALLYWVADVNGHSSWFKIIAPAGTATLLCYMLPYLWYPMQQLMEWWYPDILSQGLPGLCRSLVYAVITVMLAGMLVKAHIKLKL